MASRRQPSPSRDSPRRSFLRGILVCTNPLLFDRSPCFLFFSGDESPWLTGAFYFSSFGAAIPSPPLGCAPAPPRQTLRLGAQPCGLSRPAQQAPPPIFPGSAVEALRRPPWPRRRAQCAAAWPFPAAGRPGGRPWPRPCEQRQPQALKYGHVRMEKKTKVEDDDNYGFAIKL